jgi:hypothetical protein
VLLTSGKAEAAAQVMPSQRRRFVLKPYDLTEVARLLHAMIVGGIPRPE